VTDDQLLRYSRHVLLDEIGVEGQTKLLNSHALIIGAGGLGSPVALYLGSAGVGHITLVDADVVDTTNLQRQIAHNLARVGVNKAQSAADSIAAINPDVQVTVIPERADAARLDELVAKANIVLDCTDNFTTRHAINAACVKHRVPLVSGAAIQLDGQLSVFDPRRDDSPCYACIFPPDAPVTDAACATMGVLAPLVGIIGSMQAAQALQVLTGFGEPLVGQLLMLDARSMRFDAMRLERDTACVVCNPSQSKSSL
jgi:molybdopterin-synthase adenylyltransferase